MHWSPFLHVGWFRSYLKWSVAPFLTSVILILLSAMVVMADNKGSPRVPSFELLSAPSIILSPNLQISALQTLCLIQLGALLETCPSVVLSIDELFFFFFKNDCLPVR